MPSTIPYADFNKVKRDCGDISNKTETTTIRSTNLPKRLAEILASWPAQSIYRLTAVQNFIFCTQQVGTQENLFFQNILQASPI